MRDNDAAAANANGAQPILYAHSANFPLNTSSSSTNLQFFKREGINLNGFLKEDGSFNHLEFPILCQVTNAESLGTILNKLTKQNPDAAVTGLFRELWNLFGAAKTGFITNLTMRQRQEEVELNLNEKMDEVDKLNNEVDKLNGKSEMLMSIISSGGGKQHTKRSPEHPNPDHFTSEHPDLLNSWIQDMQLKLKRNADWFDNEQDVMAYWITRTKKDARTVLQHGINEKGVVSFESADEILEILKATYGEVDEQKNAGTRLLSMNQEKKALVTFLPGWLTHANKSGFNDVALIAMLRASLHNTLLDRLNQQTTAANCPRTLAGFVTYIRTIDAQLRETDPFYFKKGKSNNTNNSAPPPIAPAPAITPVVDAGDPMDLSSATIVWKGSDGGKRRPRTQAEKDAKKKYCLENNLLLRYTSSIARGCLNLIPSSFVKHCR